MEEQIKCIVRNLNIGYIIFWVVPALLLFAGEFELLPVGIWAGDVRKTYSCETIGILLTAAFIPLSLKFFNLALKKKIDQMTITEALKRYQSICYVRLGMLAIVVVFNIVCYYLTLSITGNLCMLIALTASLFCLPSEKKLRTDLHITKE